VLDAGLVALISAIEFAGAPVEAGVNL